MRCASSWHHSCRFYYVRVLSPHLGGGGLGGGLGDGEGGGGLGDGGDGDGGDGDGGGGDGTTAGLQRGRLEGVQAWAVAEPAVAKSSCSGQ